METSRFSLLLVLVSFSFFLSISAQMTGDFKCSGPPSTCISLVGFSSKNATTLGNIQTLFAVKNFRSILGVNNFPVNTTRNQRVNPNQVVRVPIRCQCKNGTGLSNGVPVYTVKAGDTLSVIASEIFGGLLQYQKIADVNGIPDPSKIDVDQKFRIPLPCSCDKLNGEDVLHYAHVVKLGSSLGQIAAQFGTDNTTLAQLNGISGDSQLLADLPLNVPLKVCSSSVRNNSMDAPLFLANNSYVFTAHNCIKCSCDASKNWTLSCDPSSELKPTKWTTCPASPRCEGAESLFLGNTTNSSCGPRSCAYAGYLNNQTILTKLSPTCPDSTAPGSGSDNYASTLSPSFNLVMVLIQCALLCFCLL